MALLHQLHVLPPHEGSFNCLSDICSERVYPGCATQVWMQTQNASGYANGMLSRA